MTESRFKNTMISLGTGIGLVVKCNICGECVESIDDHARDTHANEKEIRDLVSQWLYRGPMNKCKVSYYVNKERDY